METLSFGTVWINEVGFEGGVKKMGIEEKGFRGTQS